MNSYTVYFFCVADCRCDWTVEDHDELRALAAARDHHKLGTWVTSVNHLTLEISRA